LCIRRHTCFARKASLNIPNSRRPKPPLVFALHKVFHGSQCIFPLSPSCPYQNLRIKTSISFIKRVGRWKQLIAYVGIAWATDLMRTSRPAWEISFSFHPLSLLHTLSLIWEKLAYFALHTKDGNPRYFSYCFIAGTPSIPRMVA
jgi:hypothetical protein